MHTLNSAITLIFKQLFYLILFIAYRILDTFSSSPSLLPLFLFLLFVSLAADAEAFALNIAFIFFSIILLQLLQSRTDSASDSSATCSASLLPYLDSFALNQLEANFLGSISLKAFWIVFLLNRRSCRTQWAYLSSRGCSNQ